MDAETIMTENRDDGLQQQSTNAQRQQADQQNQQGESRPPRQQADERHQAQPGQQNPLADQGIEAPGQDEPDNGSVGGAEPAGDLQPGRTGDGGAER